jgi:hypothetical protein
MKIFYYTIRESGKNWDETEQHSVNANDWLEFAGFCDKLSANLNKEIRGCTTQGYRNQGSYFYTPKYKAA